jgi:hypothetical protein
MNQIPGVNCNVRSEIKPALFNSFFTKILRDGTNEIILYNPTDGPYEFPLNASLNMLSIANILRGDSTNSLYSDFDFSQFQGVVMDKETGAIIFFNLGSASRVPNTPQLPSVHLFIQQNTTSKKIRLGYVGNSQDMSVVKQAAFDHAPFWSYLNDFEISVKAELTSSLNPNSYERKETGVKIWNLNAFNPYSHLADQIDSHLEKSLEEQPIKNPYFFNHA